MAKQKRKLRKFDYRTKEGKKQQVDLALHLLHADMEHKFNIWRAELLRIQQILRPAMIRPSKKKE